MKPLYLILIALIVLSLFSPGCIENKPTSQVQTIVPTPPPTPAPKQYLDMDFKQFLQTMQSDKVTLLQKQNLYDSSIGKYVKWRGEVIEVTHNSIELNHVDWLNMGSFNTWILFVTNDQTSKLASLNKGDKITFEGLITKDSFPYAENGSFTVFQLFNGEIISKG